MEAGVAAIHMKTSVNKVTVAPVLKGVRVSLWVWVLACVCSYKCVCGGACMCVCLLVCVSVCVYVCVCVVLMCVCVRLCVCVRGSMSSLGWGSVPGKQGFTY